MKILVKAFLFFLILSGSNAIYAQCNASQATALINQKIDCCSLPLQPGNDNTIEKIEMSNGGEVSFYYTGKKVPMRFHILNLYKESPVSRGFELGRGKSQLVIFHLHGGLSKSIRLKTHEDAKSVFDHFECLYDHLKERKFSTPDLSFRQTVDAINIRLNKWSETKTLLSAVKNGNIVLESPSFPRFSFSLFELQAPLFVDGVDTYGMERLYSSRGAKGPQAWLNFYGKNGEKAQLRLKPMPDAELDILHGFFIHLRSLCTPDAREGHHFFVHRNSRLNTRSESLLASIRPVDKKDSASTTLSIESRGEGWLDKDSFPVGIWKFFAFDHNGMEYLFKEGRYQRTSSRSFDIKVYDSITLIKDYSISAESIKKDHVHHVPFVKSGNWIYWHPNGKLWKKVDFQQAFLPIYLDEVQTVDAAGKLTGTNLLLRLKAQPDEWINSEVIEYNPEGKINKKLQYYGFSEVYKKIQYNSSGEIIKEEKSNPYGSTLTAENFTP